eukprot:COSAG05_NODE_7_length_42457_cov_58.929152_10_plen_160_part_00
MIHGVIPDDKLDRARAAWLKAEAPARKRWEEGRAAAAPKNSQERLAASGESQYRTFFDIGKLYDTEDTFLDIIDSPRTLPLLCLLCGGGGESLEYNPTYGQVRFGGQGGRVVPPDINPGECLVSLSLFPSLPLPFKYYHCSPLGSDIYRNYRRLLWLAS